VPSFHHIKRNEGTLMPRSDPAPESATLLERLLLALF
jgi:hypothetical protein